MFIHIHHINFCYETAIEPLFHDVSLAVASGWSGVVGANGTGKTTFLQLITGLLEPDEGNIQAPQHSLYCPQRTDDMPDGFLEFLAAQDKTACMMRGILGVQDEWGIRWNTLSHGERKRSQIATALWKDPDVLAIDEPTNHIDTEARDVIASALHTFDGIGLLVSHDRDLLDSLCQHCLFIEPPNVASRPGGITKGLELARSEQQTLRKEQQQKKQAYKKLKREANVRREESRRADKKRSKRHIPRKDHDAKAKITRARLTGKDAIAGKLLRQLDGRLKQAEEQAQAVHVKKEYSLGIWLPGSRSHRNLVVDIPSGSLSLGTSKVLQHPALSLKPDDRIALVGPNGAGKSTLIRHLLGEFHVPREHITYVPQEIERAQSREILTQVRKLPNEKLGHLMTIISRLGSRPHRLLESSEPSPGETRKLLLALGMTRLPHLIVMDEPTNHMDLPSIECLEQALTECPCCLLLVSHDRRFLEKLTQTQWKITRRDDAEETFVLKIA